MAMCFTFVSVVLFLGAMGSTNGKKTITYTINNQLEEPFFYESMKMPLKNKKPLIWYIEQSVLKNPTRFTSFTSIFQVFEPVFSGHFIKGINGREGFWFVNRTNWQIFNASGLLIGGRGVSHYFPTPNDDLLFNYTIGFPGFEE